MYGTDEHAANLGKLLGDESRVLWQEHDLHSYSFDASFAAGLPQYVVQPLNTAEVASVVRYANQFRIPVTPRGRATCLSGGPVPVRGGIVMDLTRMNQKLEIDPHDLVAVVSPGVITADLHRAAEAYGLMYPPDPSSAHVSTIGGNLAENSGGPRGLKYGVTKDYVLGLEVVTPLGDVIRTGGRTFKNVTGYDLTRLIVGSEGTLGIITEAVLRLVPKPQAVEALLAVFDDLIAAGTAVSTILSQRIVPAKMEIMDRESVNAVEDYEPQGLPRDAAAVLLIELDGHPHAIAEEIGRVRTLCLQAGARRVVVARDEREREQLWRARRLVSPAIAAIKPSKISEDITVPISKIPLAIEALQRIREKYGLKLVIFGHAGDGNLHPNILTDRRDKEEMKRAEQAAAAIFETAVQLGGTLSGEHGIGTMKAPFMDLELGPLGVEMMKRLKEAWDPNNIMNPGKIFPEPGQRLVLTDE
jgi:glycolate oxidase